MSKFGISKFWNLKGNQLAEASQGSITINMFKRNKLYWQELGEQKCSLNVVNMSLFMIFWEISKSSNYDWWGRRATSRDVVQRRAMKNYTFLLASLTIDQAQTIFTISCLVSLESSWAGEHNYKSSIPFIFNNKN